MISRLKSILTLASILFVVSTAAAEPDKHAATVSIARIIGTWEYRQKAGASEDSEGEIIVFSEVNGRIEGQYFGLEREGEHGLYYTAEKMKNIEVGSDGRVAFTVPARTLFRKRPTRVDDEAERKNSSGFISDELTFEGRIEEDRLTLSCKSERPSCPDNQLVFRSSKVSIGGRAAGRTR